jgi:hypothetical protein
MPMKNGIFASIGCLLALTTLPSASRAGIVETIINKNTEKAVGSIDFPDITGGSAIGVLFSYGVYTQTDITSISWTLDPSTHEVTALDLDARYGDSDCPIGGAVCSYRTLTMTSALEFEEFVMCNPVINNGVCVQEIGLSSPLSFAPAGTAVPEPATRVLILAGFAGLGIAGYRRSRRLA